GYEQLPGLVLTNNLLRGNAYGVFGAGAGMGTSALQAYTNGSYIFLNNVLASDTSAADRGSYPASTSFESVNSFNSSFVDRASGNYRLVSSSPYRNAA